MTPATQQPTLAELLAGCANPAERLDRLAGAVENDPGRWCQGTLFLRADSTTSAHPEGAHAACMMGFAEIAWPGKDKAAADRQVERMARAIGVEPTLIAAWNDHEDRNPGEVAQVLRRAAGLERPSRQRNTPDAGQPARRNE